MIRLAKRKKKTEDEVTDGVEKETKASDYDYKEDLKNLEKPFYTKKGFEYYITENNIQIKSKKDFENKYNEFMKKNSGV